VVVVGGNIPWETLSKITAKPHFRTSATVLQPYTKTLQGKEKKIFPPPSFKDHGRNIQREGT
jgi:hypothetical protein